MVVKAVNSLDGAVVFGGHDSLGSWTRHSFEVELFGLFLSSSGHWLDELIFNNFLGRDVASLES